jgi:hypothetical protein
VAGKALGWGALWLALVELGLRVLAPTLQAHLRGPVAIYQQAERVALAHAAARPAVVLLGSSRMRDAAAPYVLEEALGLPRGAVVNLGLGGARPSDALALYRDNRVRLAGAVVVLGIDNWHFNAATPGIADPRFRAAAPLRERLAFPLHGPMLDLAFGYVSTVWDLRAFFRVLLIGASRGVDPRQPAFALDALGRIRGVGGEAAVVGPDADAEAARERHPPAFVPWGYELHALGELVDLVRADQGRLVLLRLPVRRAYAEAVRRDYAWQDDEWRRAVAVAAPSAPLQDLADAAEWGLGDEHFADFGHITAAGSALFTRRLAPWLARAADG